MRFHDNSKYHLASSKRLLGLAKASEVLDSSSTPKSRSEITYDYTDYSSSNTVAGNLTQSKVWDSFKGGSVQSYSDPLTGTNSITSSATYDSYGNVLTTTDANSTETQVTYGSIGGYSGLYPTQTVVAHGTSLARTSTATYDFYSGAVLSTTDEDNDITNSMEYDDLGRPINEISADGTALESWTQTVYDDVNRRIVVRADLEAVGDAKKVATQFFDQLGRVRLAKTLEDASTQSATNETDGIKVQTRYKTASGYSYQLSSNPYRADYSYNETDETMGWTLSTSWSSGIRAETQSFSGAGLPTALGGSNTNSTGIVRTDIDANRTLVTDQASKQRISKTNALGQLTDVYEIMAASDASTTSVAFPNTSIAYGYETNYVYDTLNNLTTVNQGSQTRTFAYNSLSRLTSATNPESGTISYVYDNNGNLTSKTDARSIVTSYTYDVLNHPTDRNYTIEPSGSETPDVDYFYGTTAPKVGKLTKVTSSVSTTEYTSFDILGRVTGHKQTTDGVDYTTGYTYKLSGALNEQTYPSGRVVKNELDVSGDLSSVTSKENSSAIFKTYVNDFNYNAAGAVTSLRLGNGRFESTTFNSRLQPTQIGLGTSETTQNILKLEYGYGTNSNNGNVQSQTITVPGMSHSLVQNYTYDSLNRLESATETSNSMQTWKQEFSYDRYGNRNFVSGTGHTTTLGSCTAMCNPTFDTSNNRITSTGFSYDLSGNTTRDAEDRKFTYDAENKQTKAETLSAGTNTVTGTIGEYSYDGDGKRVKKYVPATGETTIFVYDAAAKLIGEYSTIVVNPTDAKVAYLTADHLGSPRANTDVTGAVIARHDYHPFGEEIVATGSRATTGYGSDNVRNQFTGYERDHENDLDFAEARMYSNRVGRFTTPDPVYLTDGRLVDPQQVNLFAYGRNNPVRFTDPDGLDVRVDGDEWEWALGQLGNGLSFKVTQLKKGGLVQIVDSNGKVLDNKKDAAALAKIKEGLNDEESALFEAITDTKNHATLNAVKNDDNVDIGSIIKPGQNGVDRPEAEMLAKSDGQGGFTTQSIVRHELLEAYGIASGLSPSVAHDNNPVGGLINDRLFRTPDANGMVNRLTTVAGSLDDLINESKRRYYVEKSLKVPIRNSTLESDLKKNKVPKGSIVSVTYR